MPDRHDLPGHFCPGCGGAQKANPRYPWYFCAQCLQGACDGRGAGLEFANASPLGGLVWRHRGKDKWHDAFAVKCLIRRRPVIVHEARFGGVLAEPLRHAPRPSRHLKVTDLSRT